MFRAFAILSLGLLLSGCSDEVSNAKDAVQERLGSKKTEFMNIRTFAGGVVCGQYVVHTSDFSTAIDKQVFITVRGKLHQHPNQDKWDFYCTESPGEVLLNKTGIGPYEPGTPDLASVTRDMTALAAALEAYYQDHFLYPSMKQGMQALLSPPENLKTPDSYPSGGYLKMIPLDPWGRPYLYRDDQWGRTKGSFKIITLGADGVEGGEGTNADITSSYLPYLQHMAVLTAQ